MSYFNENTTVEEGKAQLLLEIKYHSFQLLRTTDWYLTRKVESETPIPADVTTYRQEVKAVSSQRCALVNACNTIEELNELVFRPYWDYATQFDTVTNTFNGEGNANAFKPWPTKPETMFSNNYFIDYDCFCG